MIGPLVIVGPSSDKVPSHNGPSSPWGAETYFHGPPLQATDPIGFQDVMCGILKELADTPVKALVNGWYAATARAVDMIAPKCPLYRRARPAPWFNQQLWAMKWNRRRLESVWKRNPMENNLKAAKVASNLYLAKVEAARKAYFVDQISEASNHQAELFCIVCDLSRIDHDCPLRISFNL